MKTESSEFNSSAINGFKTSGELPHDPAIPQMSIHSKVMESVCQGDVCTPVFCAALFKIVKRWKQPKYSSAAE
jgi:hypothetical protein